MALAAGKFRGEVVEAIAEPNVNEQALRLGPNRRELLAGNPPRQHDVFEGGEVCKQLVELKHKTQRAVAESRQLARAQCCEIAPAYLDRTTVGSIESAQTLQQG